MSTPEPTRTPVESAETEHQRIFSADGRTWIARLAGAGLLGTGRLGLAHLEVVQFFLDGESEPRSETLIPPRRFDELFESELVTLLAAARPLRES